MWSASALRSAGTRDLLDFATVSTLRVAGLSPPMMTRWVERLAAARRLESWALAMLSRLFGSLLRRVAR